VGLWETTELPGARALKPGSLQSQASE
jgi:hypothetical protein